MATNIDNITYCYALATKLMDEHGLIEQGWKFDFSTSARRIAVCKHRIKTLEFSLHRLGSDREVIKDIMLHEIAHALVGPKHGHDATWRAMCVRIGAKPNRLNSETVTTKGYNFEVCCSKCGKVVARRYRVKRSLLYNKISTCCEARLEAYDIREG